MRIPYVIDNRETKLADHINRMLASTDKGRFAVGCFFLSGRKSRGGRMFPPP